LPVSLARNFAHHDSSSATKYGFSRYIKAQTTHRFVVHGSICRIPRLAVRKMKRNREHIIIDLSHDRVGILEYKRPMWGSPQYSLGSPATHESFMDRSPERLAAHIEALLDNRLKTKIKAYRSRLSFLVPLSRCLIESFEVSRHDSMDLREWSRRRVSLKTGIPLTSLVIDVHQVPPHSKIPAVATIIAMKREDIDPLLSVAPSLKATLAFIIPAVFPRAGFLKPLIRTTPCAPWCALHLLHERAELSVWWEGMLLAAKSISAGSELWSKVSHEVHSVLDHRITVPADCYEAPSLERGQSALSIPCPLIFRNCNQPHTPSPDTVFSPNESQLEASVMPSAKLSFDLPVNSTSGLYDGLLGAARLLDVERSS